MMTHEDTDFRVGWSDTHSPVWEQRVASFVVNLQFQAQVARAPQVSQKPLGCCEITLRWLC